MLLYMPSHEINLRTIHALLCSTLWGCERDNFILWKSKTNSVTLLRLFTFVCLHVPFKFTPKKPISCCAAVAELSMDKKNRLGTDLALEWCCANMRCGLQRVCSRNLYVFSTWFTKTAAHYVVWSDPGTPLDMPVKESSHWWSAFKFDVHRTQHPSTICLCYSQQILFLLIIAELFLCSTISFRVL